MANEQIALDENGRWGLAGVTNDSNQFILNGRLNPANNRLIVEGVVTSSNTSIGSTIPGGTEGSVLFIGPGSTLAQDNSNFFWDDTNFYLGLGTDTPSATLDVEGTFKLDLGGDATGDIFYRDSSGLVTRLGIGSTGQVLTVAGGLPSWATGSGSSGITSINGDSTPAQTLSDAVGGYIDIVDAGGGSHTFAIDIGGLTSDSTFQTDVADFLLLDSTFLINLADNSTFYIELANNTNFIDDLTSNTTFIDDIVNIVNTDPSIQIDLTTQVTGILPVAHGGTGDSSFTAYAPIFGGTTSTAPLQSGTVGTTGQVLTSNGAGMLPTFQAPTGGVINTSTTSYVFDDFLGGFGLGSTTATIGELGWLTYSHNSSSVANSSGSSTANNPGVLLVTSTVSVNQTSGMYLVGTTGPLNTQTTILEANFSQTSQPGSQVFFGLTSSLSDITAGSVTDFTASSVAKVAFVGSGTSGNWVGYASDGTTQNTTSGVAMSVGTWDTLNIQTDATGANAIFTVNGTVLGTIAIPSTATGVTNIFMGVRTSTGGQFEYLTDYFFFNRTLSR